MELARQGDEALPPQAAVARMAPPAVLRMVLLRLGHLPQTCSAMARAVAVLGNDARLDRAATLSELSATDGERAADALADADILSVGEPLCFVHPLVRSSIYGDITDRQRSAAHRRVASLLNEEGAVTERIAAHLLAD